MDRGDRDPVVSIVTPVHRTQPAFLREAIDSVRAQSETRWQLVIVLDASTEECAVVARSMAADDARIRVVGEVGGRPLGSSGARNFGVASTTAPLLAFLDADDVFEPQWLHERLRILRANPEAAMVYGNTLYWHSWSGTPSAPDSAPALGVPSGTLQTPPALVSRFITGQAAVPCTCSIVVRRSVLDAVGGFDATFRDLYDDQAVYSRIALRYPIVADDQVLDRYRQHSDSMTARADAAHEARARLRFLDWLEREITRAGVTDVELAQSVARERWKLAHPRLARILRTVRRTARGLLSGLGQRSASPTGRSDTRGATNAS